MMNYRNIVFPCWKKEQDVFNKNLAVLKQQPETNAVHDIRVTIKKLRALLRLYVFLTEEQLWKYPLKETEDLFTILGKQRDIEICLELLQDLEKETSKKYPEFRRYLDAALNTAQQWTTNAVRTYKKKELSAVALMLKTESIPLTNEELKLKAIRIIALQLSGCSAYFKQPHQLRQQFKEIYYWIKMAGEILAVRVDYEKKLHPLLDEFGEWQDMQVLETRTRHFRKDHLPRAFPEYESLKKLEAVIKEKGEALLKTTLNKTRHLIKSATK